MHRLKVLITGISGFIGRSLVEEIVNSNLPWKVHGIDVKEPVFNKQEYRKHIVFSKVDIRDKSEVKAYFAKNQFDGVIHLAAISRVLDAENDKDNCIATNLNGTKYVIESVANKPETWFVFGSSREVYGEQNLFPVKESAEKRPINIYGECKLKGELLVKELIRKYAILRFSNVYGNNYDIEGRVIPAFVRRAKNDEPLYLEGGNQIIDFTFVSDTVTSIIRTADLLQNKKIQAEEIHISPGIGNRITDIIACLEQELGKKLDVQIREKRSYDVQRFVGDPSKRKAILDNSDFVTLSQGIQLYLKSSEEIKHLTTNNSIHR